MFAIIALQYECISQFTATTPVNKTLKSNSPSIIKIDKIGSATYSIFGVQISGDAYKVTVSLIDAVAIVIFSLEGTTKTVAVTIDNTNCGGQSGQTISYQPLVITNSVCPGNVKCTAAQDKQVIEAFNSESSLMKSLQTYLNNTYPKPQVFIPPRNADTKQMAAEFQTSYCMQCTDVSPYLRLDWYDDAPAVYIAVEERFGTNEAPVINVSSPAAGSLLNRIHLELGRQRNAFNSFQNSMLNLIEEGLVCMPLELDVQPIIYTAVPANTRGAFSTTQLRSWIDSVGGLEGVYAQQQNVVIYACVGAAAALAVVVAVVVVAMRKRGLKLKVQKSQDMNSIRQYVM